MRPLLHPDPPPARPAREGAAEEPAEVLDLRGADGFESLRREWLDLARQLPETSYFQTPDWVLGWWETVAGRPPTRVAIWRGGSGQLEAISLLSRVWQPIHRRLPLAVPAWINAGSGTGAADHCGSLALPHRSGAVREWIRSHASRGSVLLQNLDPEAGAQVPLPARPVWDTPCPRLVLPPGGGEVGRSSNFRQQLRARERKLRAAGVALRWIDPTEMDEGVLRALSALHERRWGERRGRSNFTPEQLALHRRLIERAGPGRGPAAIVAAVEERPIGVLYGFWWKDVFAYYQMGWDPEWARFGVGTVLLREGIRMATGRGGRVFDFLRGTEPVKYRFGAQERKDTTWLLPSGVSGRVLTLGFGTRRLLRAIRAPAEAREGQASARP